MVASSPDFPSSGVSARRAFWFAAAITIAVFAAGIYANDFTVDSWSYLELSKTVFHDFYRFHTLRQFENVSPYSNSFPPLWPVLLAVFRWVADLGIYTGYFLNLFVCLALLKILVAIFERIRFPAWLGAVCYLAILEFRPFRHDALGAGTIPLSLALLGGTLLVFFGKRTTVRRVALAGLVMGLACLNRSGALPVACVMGAAFTAEAYRAVSRVRPAVAAGAIYFATLGIALSPWVAYGIEHFGRPFPSAPMRQMLSAGGGSPTDYYEGPPQSDLRRSPVQWLASLASEKLNGVVASFFGAAARSFLPALLGAVIVAWGFNRVPPLHDSAARFALLVLLLIPVILLPAILAGSRDSGDYSGPMLLLFAVLFASLESLTPVAWNQRWSALLLAAAAFPICAEAGWTLLQNGGRVLAPRAIMAPLSPDFEMRRVTDAVRRDSQGHPHRLVFATGDLDAVRYGALTGEPTTVVPHLRNAGFASFAREWHVTHLYNPPSESAETGNPPAMSRASVMRAVDSPGIRLVPLDLPGLYRIELTAAAVLTESGSASSPGRNYWMYAGSNTARGGKGIYLYEFHAATGKVEAMGLATGALWWANRDALATSPARIFAQIRSEWPNIKLIFKGIQDPDSLAFRPDSHDVYTANHNETNSVSAFRENPANGKLTIVNSQSSGGVLPVFLTVDLSGKNILVANYDSSVAVLPIGPQGRLEPAASVIRNKGSGTAGAPPSHAHSIIMSPDNRFAITPDNGWNELRVYRFDADKGRIAPNDPAFLRAPAGVGPRQFVFHPSGSFAYAVGESGSCVMAMRWDARRGTLTLVQTVSTLPPGFHGDSAAADVQIHPSGRFLYASNRGPDNIAVFRVDPVDGTLTPVQYESSYGKRPVNMRIDPTGNYLFSANVAGDSITEFRIDPQTGRLVHMETLSQPFPMAMIFMPAT